MFNFETGQISTYLSDGNSLLDFLFFNTGQTAIHQAMAVPQEWIATLP